MSVPSSELSASTRKTGISASRMKPIALGIVHDAPRLAGERLRRRRARAVEPAQAPEREPRLLGGVLHLLAGAIRAALVQARVRHSSTAASAAPSSGSVRDSWPRRTCASSSPEASERLPDGQPQRAAEQLGVGELAAGPEVLAVVVDDVEAGLAQLAVEPLGQRVLLGARACRARPGGRRTARSSAATRCPARRRTARRRRRRCAPGRCRRSPSRSAARCRSRRGRWRPAARRSACRA